MLPFGLLLLFGVLAMHGFQASPGPSEMTGVPLTAMSTGHDPESSASVTAHHSLGGHQPGDHRKDHPGGEICLAMLTMITLIGAVIALFRREPAAAAQRILFRARILLVGRSPPGPSLHGLGVLRL
jgi:hypothetical protein